MAFSWPDGWSWGLVGRRQLGLEGDGKGKGGWEVVMRVGAWWVATREKGGGYERSDGVNDVSWRQGRMMEKADWKID